MSRIADKKAARRLRARAIASNHRPGVIAAVEAGRRLLSQDRISVSEVRSIYANHFSKTSFTSVHPKSRPSFDDDVYPPLPKGYLEHNLESGQIPSWKSSKDLLNLAAKENSALLRIMVAYVWKRGELGRVKLVRSGVMSLDNSESSAMGDGGLDERDNEDFDDPDSAAVMWQFGRHLLMPRTQPIADQHSYRAYLILAREGFLTSDTKRLAKRQVMEYSTWWNSLIKKVDNRKVPEFDAALSEIDRLLFSLGKAALLCPDEFRLRRRRRAIHNFGGWIVRLGERFILEKCLQPHRV